MKIFTDGSVIGKHGGWAFVAGSRVESGYAKCRDTYDMELTAVAEALEQCDGDICIVSDHWGIVQELRAFIGSYDQGKHPKAPEIWKRITRQWEKLQGVEWMKRQTTHEQRLADELAHDRAEMKR